jgi:Patatin-like phospholipase
MPIDPHAHDDDGGRFARALAFGARIIPWARAIALAVSPCRFSLGTLALGAVALWVPDQSAEAICALCERERRTVRVVFGLAALWWGLSSWYFARVMSHFDYAASADLPEKPEKLRRWLVAWLPRFLGLGPPIVAAVAILARIHRDPGMAFPGIIMALSGVALFGLIVVRRWVLMRMERAWSKSWLAAIPSMWQEMLLDDRPSKKKLVDLPTITLVNLGVHMLLFVVLFLVFTVVPVAVASWFGAPTIIVFALATWIAAGSALTYLFSWLRFPLFVVLIPLAVVVSPWTDDHVATPPRAKDDPLSAGRKSIALDFADWRMATGASDDTPFIVVVTEGGGIRAAYWTAAVLAALQDRNPKFAGRVYAISSVSGGSVGAAVFDSLLARRPRQSFWQAAADVLSMDSLAPPLAKMLYPDLVQRFIPHPFSCLDRGKALEDSWTDAVGSVPAEVPGNPLSGAFEGLWDSGSALPRLFLNTTWVETGKRVIISQPRPYVKSDAVDGLTHASFTLAEAVHASARFPYLSPAATLPGDGAGPWGHIVDGGYFENSGAATAVDILAALGGVKNPPRVVIIRYDDGQPTPAAAWLATEATSPPLTMLNTRDARGAMAIESLRALKLETAEFVLVHTDPALPLGWMLSAGARSAINQQVLAAMDGPAATVLGWLR